MRNTNQLTLYADTGELLVDDVKPFQRWDAVVLDVESGPDVGYAADPGNRGILDDHADCVISDDRHRWRIGRPG